jgi:hypothetical protein
MTEPFLPRVVIVDGAGTGRPLLRELLERNVECLHLRPDDASLGFDPRDYDGDLGFAGDVSHAIQLLAELAPSAVVAGSGGSTAYAEAVADGLDLQTHAIEGFNARRQAEGLLQCARPEIGPIAIQPAEVAGAPHFIVNTVSFARLHCVTDAWRLSDLQDGEACGPGALELCDPAASEGLFNFARTVLDRLGVRYGAAHIQIAITAEGPRLVGAMPSLMELAVSPAAFAAAGLESQAAVWADNLVSGPPHRAVMERAGGYHRQRQMTVAFFRFQHRSRVACLNGVSRLRSLPSFFAHEAPLAFGATVAPASTWRARGGLVHLVHESADQIAADVRQFRDWEARGELYGLEPEGAL